MRKLVVGLLVLSLIVFTPTTARAQSYVNLPTSNVPWRKTQLLIPSTTEQAFSEPSVLYENGMWRMWYRVGWTNLQGIFYATSSDGIHWTRYGHVTNDYHAHVIRYNSTTLLMYAHGLVTQHSSDGIHWYNFTEQYGLWPNPWLNQADPYPNEFGTIGNTEPVLLPNGTYLIYYESWNCNSRNENPRGQPCSRLDTVWSMNEATTPDGINSWTRSPSNPLLGGIGATSVYSAANPNVLYRNDVYYAFVNYYIENTYFVETLATSPDGIHFTFNYGPTNPVLSIDAERTANPYCNQVGDAWALPRPDGLYLYYDADANVPANDTQSHASIWLAVLPNTTLTQLAAGQFGTSGAQENVPEFQTRMPIAIFTIAIMFALFQNRLSYRRRKMK